MKHLIPTYRMVPTMRAVLDVVVGVEEGVVVGVEKKVADSAWAPISHARGPNPCLSWCAQLAERRVHLLCAWELSQGPRFHPN